MWTYETCYFFFEYGLCLLLIAYTIILKKTDTLLKSFLYTFIVCSAAVATNFIIQLNQDALKPSPAFYQINFSRFVGIALLVNAILFRKCKRKNSMTI